MQTVKKLLVTFFMMMLVFFGSSAEVFAEEVQETVAVLEEVTEDTDNTDATSEALDITSNKKQNSENNSSDLVVANNQKIDDGKAATEKVSTEKVSTEKSTTVKATSKETTTKKDSTEKTSTKKDSTEKSTTTAKETTKTTSTKTTSAKTTSAKTTSTKTTTKATTTKATTTKKATTTTTKKASYTKKDLRLLSALIYAEAGYQPYKGMVAVGNVVLNRVKSSSFSHVDTIKEVIYDRKWAVQFAVIQKSSKTGVSAFEKALNLYDSTDFTAKNQSTKEKQMTKAMKAAKAALEGDNNIGSYLCFQNKRSASSIKKKYSDYTIIGDHIFYRTK